MTHPDYDIKAERRKTVVKMLDAANAPQTGGLVAVGAGGRTIQSVVSGTGVVTATVEVYGSNNSFSSGGALLLTMALSGTTTDSAGDYISAEWPYMYVKLTAISGTSAAVTVTLGA